uniref:Oxy 1h n=1 Tax=Oxyopes lineatus TaxID=366495 RepID=A0A8D8ER21_OXYLI|nr:Oxy 1h precursor [Oxyopes lineatus]
MKCFTIATLLLLALAYCATCASNDASEFDLVLEDESMDDELAVEFLGSVDNEESLNALVGLMQLESVEEEPRFRGLAKLLKIILKSLARVVQKFLPKAAKAGKALVKAFADENAIKQQD